MLLTAWLLAALAQTPAAAIGVPDEYVRFEELRFHDRVEADGQSKRTLEATVHLATANAVAEFGQLGSAYVDGYGDVQFPKLVVEKPDGRRIEVKDARPEDVNPFGVTDTSIAADVRFRKVTLPGLEPGDRLHYRLVVVHKPLAPGRAFGEWKFVPALGDPLQTYELDLPRQLEVKIHLREGLDVRWEDVPAAPDRIVRRLAVRVPRPDPAGKLDKKTAEQWSEPDVLYAGFRSWSDVTHWWWDLSKDRLEPTAALKAEAAAIAGSRKAPRERIEALHRFVATRIRYLNVSFGIGRMQPRPAAEVLANRYGDCKDKHALLAALAAALGMDVRPVLIHSQRVEPRDEVPAPHQFDHMISVAQLGPDPAEWLWLDATNAVGVAGYLLPPLRDKPALLIERSGEARMVRTPADPPFAPRVEVQIEGAVAPDGTLRAHTRWSIRSDDEPLLRGAFAATPQNGRSELVRRSLAHDWKEGKVSNVTTSDPSDPAEPFRVEFDVERKAPSGAARSEWDLWIPTPDFGLPEPGEDAEEIEISVREFAVSAQIDLPDGVGARAPLSVTLDRPFARFESSYGVEGGRLRLTRSLKVGSKKVPAADVAAYTAFRRAVDTDRKQDFAVQGSLAGGPEAIARRLHAQGSEAFKKKDWAQAIDLFRKATESDPKVKDGFSDLGRALREAGRAEEAIAAFSRQVEVDAFHESAYAERAHTLDQIGRRAEAEKDLLKQVEVAPFKPWSYGKLGDRRIAEGRFHEAADYFSRAAALEPKQPRRWVDLAYACQRDGRPPEARDALQRALALSPPDWLKVRAAQVYGELGDAATAGELASEAVPALIAEEEEWVTKERFGVDDVVSADVLALAWHWIGAAASAAGQVDNAERYLEAAWKLAFLPRSGWALGELREKQGRLADAVTLWSQAAEVPVSLGSVPGDARERIASVASRLGPGGHQTATLTDARTVRLGGTVLADLIEEVVILAAADGRVEAIRGVSPKDAPALERQIAKLEPARLPLSNPENRAFNVVRQGLLACVRATGCALVLDVPGVSAAASLASKTAAGSIELTRIDPPDGTPLKRGQRVAVTAHVRYVLEGAETGDVSLVVQDQSYRLLVHPQPTRTVNRGSGDLVLEASFTVPDDAEAVNVFVPLSPPADESGGVTSTVVQAKYRVE